MSTDEKIELPIAMKRGAVAWRAALPLVKEHAKHVPPQHRAVIEFYCGFMSAAIGTLANDIGGENAAQIVREALEAMVSVTGRLGGVQ